MIELKLLSYMFPFHLKFRPNLNPRLSRDSTKSNLFFRKKFRLSSHNPLSRVSSRTNKTKYRQKPDLY